MWGMSPTVPRRPDKFLEDVQETHHGFFLWDHSQMNYSMLRCPRCKSYEFVEEGFNQWNEVTGRDMCELHGELKQGVPELCAEFEKRKRRGK